MMLKRTALLLLVLWISACQVNFWSSSADVSPSAPLAASPTPLELTPTPAFPPRPTAAYPTPSFPTCQPDVTAPFEPLAVQPTPVAETDPAQGPTLRRLAARRGLLIGSATDPEHFADAGYTELLARQFNLLTPEKALRWDIIHPQAQRYDFTGADALATFAAENGMMMMGHALVWEEQLPAWLTSTAHSRDEWIQILCRHVKTVVVRYRGHVYAWEVINEPFQNNGQLRNSFWMQAIGPEYIAMAFQWAREADPKALLILNEHSAEGMNEKAQAVAALAEGLVRQGVPIDGVGLQMHVWLWGPPTQDELLANMRRLAQLGLHAQITAMDVRTQYTHDSPQAEQSAQALAYRQALEACLTAPNCNVFVVWGLTDRYSWIPGFTGVPDAPLLFDQGGAAKPAFDALLDLLSR